MESWLVMKGKYLFLGVIILLLAIVVIFINPQEEKHKSEWVQTSQENAKNTTTATSSDELPDSTNKVGTDVNIEDMPTNEAVDKGNTTNNGCCTIIDAETNQVIPNVKSFTYSEEDKEIQIQLKDKQNTIYFGKDHPNGIKIRLIEGNKAAQVPLEEIMDGILDEYGEFNDIDNDVMQVGTHDFNNDNIDELIVTIGDNLSYGQVWIYSYHEVDDILKINPFHLELTKSFQDQIRINKNKIQIPYGSQGLFEEYVWVEDGFYQKE